MAQSMPLGWGRPPHQINPNWPRQGRNGKASGGEKLTPFSKSGDTIDLEILAAVKVAFFVEMIMHGRVDGSEFLETSHLSETLHRTLSSSQRLM